MHYSAASAIVRALGVPAAVVAMAAMASIDVRAAGMLLLAFFGQESAK